MVSQRSYEQTTKFILLLGTDYPRSVVPKREADARQAPA